MKTAIRTLELLASRSTNPRRGLVGLAQAEDWQQVVTLARRGGVSGLIAAALASWDGEEMPSEQRRQLLMSSLVDEGTNTRLMQACIRLCQAADEQGLALVPLKGASLFMGRPYQDLGLRSMMDLDLLIQRQDLPRVEALLRQQGYRVEARREQAVRHEHHVRYRSLKERGAVLVELHWTPFQTLFSTLEQDAAVFGRLVPASYSGHEVCVLDDADTLLSLLCHLAHHRFAGQLKWAADCAAFVEHVGASFDWSLFWDRADALGARGAMAYALELIGQLYEVPQLPSPPASHLLSWPLLDRLNPAEQLINGPSALPPLWQRTATDVLLLDSPLAAARYLGFKVPELIERSLGHYLPRRWVRGRGIAN